MTSSALKVPGLQRVESLVTADSPSPREGELLFDELLGVIGTAPPERFAALFGSPSILRYLSENLTNGYLRMPLDAGCAPKGGRSFIRVRELSPLGRYPNAEIVCHRSVYRIHRGRPYVVSEISPTEEAKWSYGSELADWSRQEVRMASAISCVERGGFIAYMTSGAFDIPHAVLMQVATADRSDLALECAALLAEAWDRSPSGRYRRAQMTAPPFEFGDYRRDVSAAKRFYAGFRISNPLLLRTASHYLKATMLWATDSFREEALASLMFALEGCLLLFQEVEGAQTARLDRPLLSDIFRRTYCYGEATMHFVEEGIGWGANRAQMIHPQLADENGWKPLIFGEDYYGFDKLVRALLTYLITGRSFDDYELNAALASVDPADAVTGGPG
jgi:hypothetical protein